MKRKFSKGLIMVVCLVLFLTWSTGFGKIEAKTVKVDTIQVWTNNSATKAEDEKMVADFNNGAGKSKGIKIEYRIYGGDYNNVLNIAAAANEAPHLFKLQQGSIGQFIKVGWVIPIETMPGGKSFLRKYHGYLQPGYNLFNGKTYSVPIAVSTLGVAYNKDLLKKNGFTKPPATWNELREMAKVITKNGEGKEFGIIEGLKSTGTVSANGLWHYASSVGHSQFNQKTGRFDYKSLKPVLQLWADLKADGSWFPGIESLSNDQARAQFAEGNIGFKLSASWDPAVWADQFPTKMNWGICRPVENPKNRYRDYAYQTFSVFLGSKAKELPEKSMEVLKLFSSDAMIVNLYESGKQIPYKPELIKMSKAQPTMKNFAEFADLSSTYRYPMSPKAYLKVEGETEEVVVTKVILGYMSPEQAVADLDKRYNEALDRAVKEGLDISLYVDKTDLKFKKK